MSAELRGLKDGGGIEGGGSFGKKYFSCLEGRIYENMMIYGLILYESLYGGFELSLTPLTSSFLCFNFNLIRPLTLWKPITFYGVE